MLNVTYAECHIALYAECHYAECQYAECHYAECRGAYFFLSISSGSQSIEALNSYKESLRFHTLKKF